MRWVLAGIDYNLAPRNFLYGMVKLRQQISIFAQFVFKLGISQVGARNAGDIADTVYRFLESNYFVKFAFCNSLQSKLS